MVRVPQLYNLDLSRLTAPFRPLSSLAQGRDWLARAEGPEDAVRITETRVLPQPSERPCKGEVMKGEAP